MTVILVYDIVRHVMLYSGLPLKFQQSFALYFIRLCVFVYGLTFPSGPRSPPCPRFRYHTQLATPYSVGLLWTSDQPVAETSLYSTKHNTHKKQKSILLEVFEPTITASERP
jgi:hypothetical protein